MTTPPMLTGHSLSASSVFILQATLTESFQGRYRDKIKSLHDSSMVADLYLCSYEDRFDRWQEILKEGFSPSGKYSYYDV